ncbi:MAG: hypothetical protein J6N15_01070 [Ruminiclostridium sp.]|nr:hypothetical protein [Ruminiclostridium sp.]
MEVNNSDNINSVKPAKALKTELTVSEGIKVEITFGEIIKIEVIIGKGSEENPFRRAIIYYNKEGYFTAGINTIWPIEE